MGGTAEFPQNATIPIVGSFTYLPYLVAASSGAVLPMNPLTLCVLFLAVTEAMAGMRKLRIPRPPKALKPKFLKGKPFSLELYVEKGHRKRLASRIRGALKPKSGGWLSRLTGALRRPKKKDEKVTGKSKSKRRFGIFGKEIIEGSGFTAMNGTVDDYGIEDEEFEMEASGLDPNATEIIHDDIQSRVFGGVFFKYGYALDRPMVPVTVNGKRYKMMFDTGSTMSMVPQTGCTSDPLFNLLCHIDPLFDPPTNDDPSLLSDHTQHYVGLPGKDYHFKGKVRDVTLKIGTRDIYGSLTTATYISEIEYPMFGASPDMTMPNLPFLILHGMAEAKKWFTVWITPSNHNSNVMNSPSGIVVFGDIDHRRCGPQITWMSDMTSADHGYFGAGLNMWTMVLESVWIDNLKLWEQVSAQSPMYAKTDTGAPAFILISDAFNSLTTYLGIIPQNGNYNLPCSQQFVVYLRVRNHENTQQLDIPVRSQHLTAPSGLAAPNDCTLLIQDGGPNTYFTFGFPLYRSVCVVHDLDKFRMGFAPFKMAPAQTAPSQATPVQVPNAVPNP